MNSLSVLMEMHKTDKFSVHRYDIPYEREFRLWRDRHLKLLEIGVGGYADPQCGGESLKVWRDYFPSASIVGLDIYPKRLDFGPRVAICHGSQTNDSILIHLAKVYGPFDIVIDDGSHIQSDVMQTFRDLFPLLAPGGIYVIEDLGTAYQIGYGDWSEPKGLEAEWASNGIELASRLTDALHHGLWKDRVPSEIEKSVERIAMSREILFVHKKA